MSRMKIQIFWHGQLIVYSQLIVNKTQMTHLEASDAEIAQSKDVWNENTISWGQLFVNS